MEAATGEETIGSRIRTYRLKKGLSQTQLAQQLGVSVSAISQFESGNIDPTLARLEQIAEALGVRPGTLFPRKRSDEKRC